MQDWRAIAVVAVLVFGGLPQALGLPSSARATLAYVRADRGVVVARDDGSVPRQLATGDGAVISPNGKWLAVTRFRGNRSNRSDLELVNVRTGRRKLLGRDMFSAPVIWSPNSRYLAVDDGAAAALFVIDIQSGHRRRVAVDFVAPTATFSPDSKQLLIDDNFLDSDTLLLIRFGRPGAQRLGSGAGPRWGKHAIAYTTTDQSRYDPGTYWQIRMRRTPRGGSSVLLRTSPTQAVKPIGWSADGNTLLAEPISPSAGSERVLLIDRITRHQRSIAIPPSRIDALSKDGSTLLAEDAHNIVAITLSGQITVLATDAASASWTR